jgi:hypothetical protein
MKKKKLSLDNLRVTSFVTEQDQLQVMGGAQTILECVSLKTGCVFTFNSGCHTCGFACTAMDPCI